MSLPFITGSRGTAVHSVSLSAIKKLQSTNESQVNVAQCASSSINPLESQSSSIAPRSACHSQAKENTPEQWGELNKRLQEEFSAIFPPDQNVYAFAPELSEIDIPIRKCLDVQDYASLLHGKPPFRMAKKTRCGLSGKVKFLHFQNDPDSDRWFAIKRPITFIRKIFQTGQDISAYIEYYRKNFEISKKVGDHPNFMKVHGITVKNVKNGTRVKPYMILEYIQGRTLHEIEDLDEREKAYLFKQLKSALIHLYRLKILPMDANYGNFLVTDDLTLKLIDFDAWQEKDADSSKDLGVGLLYIAERFAEKILKTQGKAVLPSQETISSEEKLVECLDRILKC